MKLIPAHVEKLRKNQLVEFSWIRGGEERIREVGTVVESSRDEIRCVREDGSEFYFTRNMFTEEVDIEILG